MALPCRPSRWHTTLLLAASICCGLRPCYPAEASRAQQIYWLFPHFGYIYPAGGQQGTTVEATVGGEFLRSVSGVHVVGEGLHIKVGKYHRPFTAEDFFRVQNKTKELRERFQDERAKAGSRMVDAKALYQKLMGELGITEEDIQDMREFAMNATNPKRQFNAQISETVVLQIQIASNAPAGQRELRLETPAGLSNPLSFRVGVVPEYRKNGTTGTTDTEIRSPLPVTLNGQILPGGGSDRFSFKVRKGAQLVAIVSARDLIPYLADAVPGWFQAAVTLYDAHGEEVAYADDYRFQPDPVLHYEVPADGRYTLEIKDALYRGRQDFVYRIALGELPFVTGVFPLGGHAGSVASLDLTGWNLPTEHLTLGAADSTPGIHWRKIVAQLLPLAADVFPECLEREPNDSPETAQPLTLPVVVNGRIDRPGDWDVFRFEGRADETIVAEVYARRLGSPLDSLLKLTDATGRLLAANDDYEDKGVSLITHQADSRISFSLPAAGTYYLHLGDVQHKGGIDYVYRLRVGPPQPNFALRVVPASVNARAGTAVPITVYALRHDGFNGPIGLALKNPPAGLTLSGAVVPAGQDQVRLTLLVPPTSSEKPISLSLEGRATIQGREVRRLAVPAEDMIQAFAYHQLVPAWQWLLTIGPRRGANYWWKLADERPVRLPVGGTARVAFMVTRQLGDWAQLALSDPPEGVTLQSTSPSANGVTLIVRADAKKAKSGWKGNLIIDASMEREIDSSKAKAKSQSKLRIPLGSLPAVPLEIVER